MVDGGTRRLRVLLLRLSLQVDIYVYLRSLHRSVDCVGVLPTLPYAVKGIHEVTWLPQYVPAPRMNFLGDALITLCACKEN